MKKLLMFALLLFWAVPAFAQVDTAWVRRYNGPGNNYDVAFAIAVDGSGNVCVTGYSYGTGTGADYATIKYYPNGDTAWVRRYNGPGNDWDFPRAIAIDDFENVYVTGESGIFPNYDYATVKYFPNGDTAWVRRYNGPGNSWDYAHAIAVDGSGNVYVTGTSDDYATIKYFPDGDTAWLRRYNGPGNSSDVAFAMAVDGSGNVYVTGYSEGSGSDYDYATIKYYPNGDTAWVRRYNGPGNSGDVAYAIAVDGSGNVYVTGLSVGSGTGQDYATIKYYPDGNTAWMKRYNGPGNSGDVAYAIAVDGSGNVYLTGWSFGSGTLSDYATIKYFPNGDTAWVRRYNGPGSEYDEALAIAVDGSGNVYVTGGIGGGSVTYLDYATIKYYSNGDTAWVRRYNGPGNYDDYGKAVAVDGAENVYVTGPSGMDYATIKYIDLSAPPEIWNLCSNKAPNVNSVYMTITGFNIDSLAAVKLVRSGSPGDSIIGSDVTVLSYNTKIICRFDLAGQPVGSTWNLVVTNPNWKADTLYNALTIVEPNQLSPKDVLCILSSNHERIEDFQANAKAWSKFNGEPLDSVVHSITMYKSPDKTKTIGFSNQDTTQIKLTTIIRGWMCYEIDPVTDSVFEGSILEEQEITTEQFLGRDFYNPQAFLNSHYVQISNIYGSGDSLFFVIEAIPKISNESYSKMELHVDYTKGNVVQKKLYEDEILKDIVNATQLESYNGIWVASEYISYSYGDTDIYEGDIDTLETLTQLSNIQVNVGIPDSVFDVEPGKIIKLPIPTETPISEESPMEFPKAGGPRWAEWHQPGLYRPRPILFLHGMADGRPCQWGWGSEWGLSLMHKLAPHFQYEGGEEWDLCSILNRHDEVSYGRYLWAPNFPNKNGSIDREQGDPDTCWADRLSLFVNSTLQQFGGYPNKIDLVCHSMGGLVAREYVTNTGYYGDSYNKVKKIITVATPHLGAETADLAYYAFVVEDGPTRCPERFRPGVEWARRNMRKEWRKFMRIDPQSAAVLDMRTECPANEFLQNLYNRGQHESVISYYAIAGSGVSTDYSRFIPGPDDGTVSYYSQLGIRYPTYNCGEFFHYLKGASSKWGCSHDWETFSSTFHQQILRFLDDNLDVKITYPESDDYLSSDVCTVKVDLQHEHLPATTKLKLSMTRVGDSQPIFNADECYFGPHSDWNSAENDYLRGYFDTSFVISKAPPGKYTITAEVTNPAGLEDRDEITIILGVDLLTQIGGGLARRGFNKDYGIAYSNIGNAKASNITVEETLPPEVSYVSSSPPGNLIGNKVQWDFDSLAAGQSGNVSVTVYIPPNVPQGTILYATSNISTTDDDVDLSNNPSAVSDPVVGSWDPNDKKVQPKGYGQNGYIGEGQRLHYTVYFENVDTATAEAVYVTVVDTLDPNLNWNSLQFGPMSHPDKCTPSFDPVSGVITWFCDSIMLPPNVNPPEGEGWFTFSILPQYLQHGTEIKNRASIQFDFNPWMYAPMDSSYIINTMDEYPPNSKVVPLWDTVGSLDFEVNWKGQDDSLGFGSGIKDYTIYVSDNGAPYEVWIADTSDTFATFHGELAHTYCFKTVAEDSVGNIEEPPPAPDACTRTPTFIRGDANSDGLINSADVAYLINYLFVGGPAPQPLQAGDANCDGTVNSADVAYLINYLFVGGPPPCR